MERCRDEEFKPTLPMQVAVQICIKQHPLQHHRTSKPFSQIRISENKKRKIKINHIILHWVYYLHKSTTKFTSRTLEK